MAVQVTNRTQTGCTVLCEGNDVIDLGIISPQANRAVITRFKGSGELEFSVTDVAGDFVGSGYSEGDMIPPGDSLTRYARITESGDKVVDIVFI